MSDFTTTLQDSYREFCTQVHGHAVRVGAELRRRASAQDGQTAAEYMGILLVVSVIIIALATSNIGSQIVSLAEEQINKIGGKGGE